MDKIWLSTPERYSEIINESREYILYPRLKAIIKKFNPSNLFDYGAGDGTFVDYLNSEFNIGIYDISKKAIAIAKKKVNNNVRVYNSKASIPSNHYDVVVFSLVLMTMPTKKVINESLKEIKRIKKQNGKFVVAITHPCFRDKKFSSFYTEFKNKGNYHYSKNGKKYKVILEDTITNKKISFYDYHWSLSFTINAIILNKFKIVEMIELEDTSVNKKYYNRYFPPYLVIICE